MVPYRLPLSSRIGVPVGFRPLVVAVPILTWPVLMPPPSRMWSAGAVLMKTSAVAIALVAPAVSVAVTVTW